MQERHLPSNAGIAVRDRIAIKLIDARGGRVRLNLSIEMAELLREKVSAALDKT